MLRSRKSYALAGVRICQKPATCFHPCSDYQSQLVEGLQRDLQPRQAWRMFSEAVMELGLGLSVFANLPQKAQDLIRSGITKRVAKYIFGAITRTLLRA